MRAYRRETCSDVDASPYGVQRMIPLNERRTEGTIDMTESASPYDMGPIGMSADADVSEGAMHAVTGAYDLDGDGKIDMISYDRDGDGRTDKVVFDRDGDGVADHIGLDRDGDGELEFLGTDRGQDGDIDTVETDTDGDGHTDTVMHSAE
jgi:hypothetical protein